MVIHICFWFELKISHHSGTYPKNPIKKHQTPNTNYLSTNKTNTSMCCDIGPRAFTAFVQ
eukprot:NODE_624_length_1558_cov_95.188204_g514_i0.p5 GENE.NODE_624_length_1558_cov_95.188204_g514_i0~~NODE_624_length_1558_cov_95.188204_g514_i0.p5  ORF type:complete len:60 (-),score=3.04 NODE_624_length_1558_cov_95.188204_g514_i0:547-726(-)